MTEDLQIILAELEPLKNETNVAGMARFGIESSSAYGVPMPVLRKLAKTIGKNHRLAIELWDCGVHEGKIMATLIADPKKITRKEADHMVEEIYSWDICDQLCNNLLYKAPFAPEAALDYSHDRREFVRRAGIVLMTCFVVHDKKLSPERIALYLNRVEEESPDDRNFVKKAVNWLLRSIGKRNERCREQAIAVSEKLAQSAVPSARWIGKDALRELTSEKCYIRKHP